MNKTTERSRHASEQSLTELQILLQERFNIMVTTVMPEFAEKAKASKALVLPDNEFFELFYTTVLEKNARAPEKEIRKLKRRAHNLSSFYEEVEKMGGVIKVNDVAEILDISRQAVNLRIKGNKLLAFKKNSDYAFPLFQFKKGGGLLPHFEDVMKSMSADIGVVSRISFLTTPLGSTEKTPLEIMQNDDSFDDVALMMRAAKQMGEQLAS
jgi:hypothetical protein